MWNKLFFKGSTLALTECLDQRRQPASPSDPPPPQLAILLPPRGFVASPPLRTSRDWTSSREGSGGSTEPLRLDHKHDTGCWLCPQRLGPQLPGPSLPRPPFLPRGHGAGRPPGQGRTRPLRVDRGLGEQRRSRRSARALTTEPPPHAILWAPEAHAAPCPRVSRQNPGSEMSRLVQGHTAGQRWARAPGCSPSVNPEPFDALETQPLCSPFCVMCERRGCKCDVYLGVPGSRWLLSRGGGF